LKLTGKALRTVLIPIVVALAPISPGIDGLAPAKIAHAQKSGGFWYSIKPCKETEKESLSTKASGSNIEFTQVLKVNCAALDDLPVFSGSLKLDYTRKRNNLRVREIAGYKTIASCDCYAEINGRIGGLEKGTYKLTFEFEDKAQRTYKIVDVREIDMR
jgi:hypothetical protein